MENICERPKAPATVPEPSSCGSMDMDMEIICARAGEERFAWKQYVKDAVRYKCTWKTYVKCLKTPPLGAQTWDMEFIL